MATTSPTRIDDDVFESARHFGATMSRSASQQVTHWARIGRELEAGASVSPREIAKAVVFLARDADYITGFTLDVNGGLRMD